MTLKEFVEKSGFTPVNVSTDAEEIEEADEWACEDVQELPELPGSTSEDAVFAAVTEEAGITEAGEAVDEERTADDEERDAEAQE